MRTASTLGGFALGLVLALSAFAAAGFGHGSYVLLDLVSAPLCIVGVAAALIGTVFLWTVAAWLASGRDLNSRRAFVLLIAAHYVSALVAVAVGPDVDWSRAPRVVTALSIGAVAYASTQVFLWFLFRQSLRKARMAIEPAN